MKLKSLDEMFLDFHWIPYRIFQEYIFVEDNKDKFELEFTIKKPKMKSQKDIFLKVIYDLMNEEWAKVFLKPVNYANLKLHDYPEIISNPMDLSTVNRKVKNGKYANSS